MFCRNVSRFLDHFQYSILFLQLTEIMTQAVSGAPEPSFSIADEALKLAMRCFASRFALGCSVIDCHNRLGIGRGADGGCVPPTESTRQHPEAGSVGRALRACQEDPITLTLLAQRLAYLRGASKRHARAGLLRRMAELDLGVLETRLSAKQLSIVFHRHPLNETRAELLRELRVPTTSFRAEHASELEPVMRGLTGDREPSQKTVEA